MSKSRRRRINDAATPTAYLSGSEYNPKLAICVHPFGEPNKAVTFELDWWQWRNLAKDVKGRASVASEKLTERARQIQSFINEANTP
ncbi:MAG: hypothetical protein JSR30_00220 [Proteobacteria bacterium]|nr:hypothetical protein [Pseudomonadota bacterium]